MIQLETFQQRRLRDPLGSTAVEHYIQLAERCTKKTTNWWHFNQLKHLDHWIFVEFQIVLALFFVDHTSRHPKFVEFTPPFWRSKVVPNHRHVIESLTQHVPVRNLMT